MTKKHRHGIESRVVAQATHVEWDLYGEIEEHDFYAELIEALKEATQNDRFIIRINSPGGAVDVGFMIVEALRKTKAETVAYIVWPSASMASVIACACDHIVFEPHTYLMFHTYTSLSYGKSGDLIKDVTETHRSITGAFTSVICPFLTKRELKDMDKGEEIYVRADDANLNDRIKRHFKKQIIE